MFPPGNGQRNWSRYGVTLDIVYHIQTKRKGHFGFVFTLSSGLYAFLNRELFDRQLNWSYSYFGYILGN